MKFKIAGILVILLAAYLGAKSFVGDPFSSAKWQITTEGQSRQRDDSSCGLLKITPRDARSLLKERFSLEISEGMLVSGLSIHFADHKNDEYCNGFRKIAAHQDVPTPTSAQLRYNTRFPASTPIGSLVIHPGRGGLISKSAGISWDCEGDAGICARQSRGSTRPIAAADSSDN